MRMLTIGDKEIMVEREHNKSFLVYSDTDSYWGSSLKSAISNFKSYEIEEKIEEIAPEFSNKELDRVNQILEEVKSKLPKINWENITVIKEKKNTEYYAQIRTKIEDLSSEIAITDCDNLEERFEELMIHELAHHATAQMFGFEVLDHGDQFNFILRHLGQPEYR